MIKLWLILVLFGAYFAASLNFAILFFRIFGKNDPRLYFSGNPGSMNVYRQAGLLWASIVFILEVGRAVIIAWISKITLPSHFWPWVACALVVGNRFPCFYQFKGGKGVANLFGFTVLISPLFTGVSALAWMIVYKVLHVTYIASFVMIAILATGIMISCGWHTIAVGGTILVVGLIIHGHKSNIIQQNDEN